LGPEGGAGGGRILVTGTPETVATTPGSHTGHFLAPHLDMKPAKAAKVESNSKRKPALRKKTA
jgi:excinuclease ABC subunit A